MKEKKQEREGSTALPGARKVNSLCPAWYLPATPAVPRQLGAVRAGPHFDSTSWR